MKRRKFDFFNNQFPALFSFMLFGGYFHILSLPREPVLFVPANRGIWGSYSTKLHPPWPKNDFGEVLILLFGLGQLYYHIYVCIACILKESTITFLWLQYMQHCPVIKLLSCFVTNEWCMKNSLLSRGFGPSFLKL
jgi:hypothetical protein